MVRDASLVPVHRDVQPLLQVNNLVVQLLHLITGLRELLRQGLALFAELGESLALSSEYVFCLEALVGDEGLGLSEGDCLVEGGLDGAEGQVGHLGQGWVG